MLHVGSDRAFDQRAGLHRVVEIVAERIRNGIRHDDLRGEMRNGVDTVFGDNALHHRLIAHVALHQLGVFCGTAHQNPADISSSTTTVSPASTSSWAMWLPI